MTGQWVPLTKAYYSTSLGIFFPIQYLNAIVYIKKRNKLTRANVYEKVYNIITSFLYINIYTYGSGYNVRHNRQQNYTISKELTFLY